MDNEQTIIDRALSGIENKKLFMRIKLSDNFKSFFKTVGKYKWQISLGLIDSVDDYLSTFPEDKRPQACLMPWYNDLTSIEKQGVRFIEIPQPKSQPQVPYAGPRFITAVHDRDNNIWTVESCGVKYSLNEKWMSYVDGWYGRFPPLGRQRGIDLKQYFERLNPQERKQIKAANIADGSTPSWWLPRIVEAKRFEL